MSGSTSLKPSSKPLKSGHNRDLGRKGEADAVLFLEERGFEILERNYRFGRSGEIDVIARKGNLVVFVEVKDRTSDAYGGAPHAVSARKLRTMKLAARHYAARNFLAEDITYRFDVIAIDKGSLQWIEDAIR